VRSTNRENARFVFSGAAVRTPVSEAQMMADYAVALGVPPGNVVIEDKSRTTVENVVNSAGLLADGSVVMLASNTFHARRARQVICDESPQLAGCLVRARDYIPFEWGLLHLVLVAFEAYRERRARAAAPT
jgi:vancomycin permeability regulator SanA